MNEIIRSIEEAQLRKKMDKENVMDEYKSRQAYVKPCEARRRAAGLIR